MLMDTGPMRGGFVWLAGCTSVADKPVPCWEVEIDDDGRYTSTGRYALLPIAVVKESCLKVSSALDEDERRRRSQQRIPDDQCFADEPWAEGGSARHKYREAWEDMMEAQGSRWRRDAVA